MAQVSPRLAAPPFIRYLAHYNGCNVNGAHKNGRCLDHPAMLIWISNTHTTPILFLWSYHFSCKGLEKKILQDYVHTQTRRRRCYVIHHAGMSESVTCRMPLYMEATVAMARYTYSISRGLTASAAKVWEEDVGRCIIKVGRRRLSLSPVWLWHKVVILQVSNQTK